MRRVTVAGSEAWGGAYRASGVAADVAERATAVTTAFYVPDGA